MLIKWDDEKTLPCHIWGFVNLTSLPKDIAINYKSNTVERGIFAIVEIARPVVEEDEVQLSEIFSLYTKEIGGIIHECVSKMSYYLADVEAIIGPVIMIPDINGSPNNYLRVKNMEIWGEDFMEWLEEKDEFSKLVESDSDDSDDDVGNYDFKKTGEEEELIEEESDID